MVFVLVTEHFSIFLRIFKCVWEFSLHVFCGLEEGIRLCLSGYSVGRAAGVSGVSGLLL